MLKSRKTNAALSVVILALMLTVMACTANDTWIIHLTLTPTPTITPTPLVGDSIRFKLGDKLIIIGNSAFAPVGLNTTAGPFRAASSATQCLPKTNVTILDVSMNITDSSDTTVYYQVSCNGKKGWVPEYQITDRVKGTTLVIKSEDGSGAALYQQNDSIKGKPLDNKCPDGTQVTVDDVQTGKQTGDTGVYFQITCDKLKGYVMEKDVASAN
ncbi:MAG: hypothetical protein KF716_00620 [Anaerolineae bacterium]|nr:hypothetical protein [Anaerolineae bacterium]